MQTDRLIPLAKELLTVSIDETTSDLWLWEHSERTMRIARMLVRLPEVEAESADLEALTAAALFHDAGWIVEYQQGRWQRWQLLSRPTNDIQRELGAAMLQEEASPILPSAMVRDAADIIRQCNDRNARRVEARVLAEAETLDEVGTLYLLRQHRQYQAEGRPLQQLYDSWQRQREYGYWALRLNNDFRYETTRALAERRLEAVDAYLMALGRDLLAADVRQLLADIGVAAPAEPS